MRKVEHWIAWDDTEFDTELDCLLYEKHAVDMLMIVSECFSFYDKDMNRFDPPMGSNLDEWLTWFSNSGDCCAYVLVKEPLPQEVQKFMSREWGYYLPTEDSNELGLFQYDYLKDEWVKME